METISENKNSLVYDKIQLVLDHIQNVQRNCNRLGLKLIKKGVDTDDKEKIEFGRCLIANGQLHDNSKFKGIEFEHLFYGDPILKDAVHHHSSTNQHHPEFWGCIQKMPEIYLAEMACDCAARSAEFGTDIRKWMTEVATKKYGFEIGDRVGTALIGFVDELLSPAFK